MDTMNSRLRHARIQAGFQSARAAALRHGWSTSTYAAHENGQNGFDAKTALTYAKAFGADPGWIVIGIESFDTTNHILLSGEIRDCDEIEFKKDELSTQTTGNPIYSLVSFPESAKGFVVSSDRLWPRYDKGSLIVTMEILFSEYGFPLNDEELIFDLGSGGGLIGKVLSDYGDRDLEIYDVVSHTRHRPIRIEHRQIQTAWVIWMIVPPNQWSFIEDDIRQERERAYRKKPIEMGSASKAHKST